MRTSSTSDLRAFGFEFYLQSVEGKASWDGIFAGARNVFVRIGSGQLHFYAQPPRDGGRGAVHHLRPARRGLEGTCSRDAVAASSPCRAELRARQRPVGCSSPIRRGCPKRQCGISWIEGGQRPPHAEAPDAIPPPPPAPRLRAARRSLPAPAVRTAKAGLRTELNKLVGRAPITTSSSATASRRRRLPPEKAFRLSTGIVFSGSP